MDVPSGIFAILILCSILSSSFSHPTIYRYNEDNNLEPALIPVSSTVIPLPVYEVGYGYRVKDSRKKTGYPPETLITVKSKKQFNVEK